MAFTIDPRLVETVAAPTNIAVVKYWGKENSALNTPINSSVSLTLDQVGPSQRMFISLLPA